MWPIDRTLSGATSPGQSGYGSDSNERLLSIFQSSCINGASPSDCLVSYPGFSLECSYPSAKNPVGVFYSSSQLGHRILVGGVLSLCREGDGVFYNPSWLGCELISKKELFIKIPLYWIKECFVHNMQILIIKYLLSNFNYY